MMYPGMWRTCVTFCLLVPSTRQGGVFFVAPSEHANTFGISFFADGPTGSVCFVLGAVLAFLAQSGVGTRSSLVSRLIIYSISLKHLLSLFYAIRTSFWYLLLSLLLFLFNFSPIVLISSFPRQLCLTLLGRLTLTEHSFFFSLSTKHTDISLFTCQQ